MGFWDSGLSVAASPHFGAAMQHGPQQGSGGMVPAIKNPSGRMSIRPEGHNAVCYRKRVAMPWIQLFVDPLLLILDLDLRLDVLFTELDILAGDRLDQIRHRLSHRLLFAQRLLEAGDVREAGRFG